MGYTIALYAIQGREFGRRLHEERDGVLKQLQAKLKRDSDWSPKDIRQGMAMAEQICRGEIPPDCEEDYFTVLSWLAGMLGEEIALSTLSNVRSFSYFTQTGIWPLLSKSLPPFSVPKAESVPPGVGYLPWDWLSVTTCDEIEQLLDEQSRIDPMVGRLPWKIPGFGPPPSPKFDTSDIIRARQQFSEVVESVIADKLDLLAIV